ncbi:DUF4138 domain-containing protein [Rudanella paleaurantiibacter]|uniref:DUF4138 domain-containing protein n=1 Tax=Rudanella paleaurantiibacter TaxID=2614655 RepID=A0A7J5TU44_9BACT|nr:MULTISPECIES: DUF4138 domain-containing protein [Rudanella]KAB7725840.1 DUF4138 domain-containing protein [Rudanella paleaurantiibacter]
MKKLFIPLLLALGLSRLGHAQTYLPDTIRVNRLTTTYLIFPGKVSLVDISPEYLIKIESGNIVFVRPRLTTARKTPIFVRTDNATYLGYLAVSGKTPPAFVEVSKLLNPVGKPADRLPNTETAVAAGRGVLSAPVASTTTAAYAGPLLASLNPLAGVRSIEEERPTTTKDVVRAAKSLLQIRMDSLLSGPATHHATERNSGISVRLTHLVHDTTNTYLQLTVGNKTAMPFLLDQVSFWYQHQAKKRKGAYLDGETYPMEPLAETAPERIEAGQTVSLRFALPQFAPQSRSSFVINLREKTGTRNVTMTLPMREVLYARPRKPLLKGRFFETQSLISFLRHEPKR